MMIALADAREEATYGGKAVQLGALIRAGLPVPPGYAIAAADVDAIVAGDTAAIATLASTNEVAVRSSAIGEDSGNASFAGLHRTVLHVSGTEAIVAAIAEVHASATSQAALAYRAKLGVTGTPRIGTVVQSMVAADRAGVLFTRDPVTGRDERVIESSWGLGEAIVAGKVTPDLHRVARDGRVLESVAGHKDIEIRRAHDGGVVEVPVPPERAVAFCLSLDDVARLHDLACACERVFGPEPADIEWAFSGNDLFLLQRRPITR